MEICLASRNQIRIAAFPWNPALPGRLTYSAEVIRTALILGLHPGTAAAWPRDLRPVTEFFWTPVSSSVNGHETNPKLTRMLKGNKERTHVKHLPWNLAQNKYLLNVSIATSPGSSSQKNWKRKKHLD